MLIKIKQQLVELLEEEPPDSNDGGLAIALGVLLFTFGLAAALLAVIL